MVNVPSDNPEVEGTDSSPDSEVQAVINWLDERASDGSLLRSASLLDDPFLNNASLADLIKVRDDISHNLMHGTRGERSGREADAHSKVRLLSRVILRRKESGYTY